MRKTVNKLRDLPIKERRTILHFSMIVFSFIVFGLWTMTLRYDFQSPETKIELEQSAKPFVEFGSQVAGSYSAFQESTSATDYGSSNTENVTELKSTLENGEE